MKKLFTYILICSIGATLLGGCKKYEEGPYLTFISKKERISNIWRVTYFEDNDPNGEGYPVLIQKFYKYKVVITIEKEGAINIKKLEDDDDKEVITYKGQWNFSNKNNDLYWTWDEVVEDFEVVFNDYSTWEIRKLTEDEINIISKDGRFRIHLIPFS